jgi:superfamily I DNA/RNA helicase
MPQLIRAEGRWDEARLIVEQIRDETAHGTQLSDIAIIVRHDADADFFFSELCKAGIAARLADSKGKATLFLGDPSVKIVSMHSSKGLEFPVVLIPRIGQMPKLDEDPVHEARLLYVALTRTTGKVSALYDQDSEFAGKIRSAIYEARSLG